MALKRLSWIAAVLLALEVVFITRPIERYALPVTIAWLPNGCEVAAREMEAAVTAEQELRHYKVWAHIVGVSYGWWRREGHAYCVYTLGNDSIVAYDINNGTVNLGTRDKSIRAVAVRLKRFYPAIRTAHYDD